MLVSDEYPWAKLLKEYAMYCAVGCFNVAIFAALYLFFNNYNSWTPYAVSYTHQTLPTKRIV